VQSKMPGKRLHQLFSKRFLEKSGGYSRKENGESHYIQVCCRRSNPKAKGTTESSERVKKEAQMTDRPAQVFGEKKKNSGRPEVEKQKKKRSVSGDWGGPKASFRPRSNGFPGRLQRPSLKEETGGAKKTGCPRAQQTAVNAIPIEGETPQKKKRESIKDKRN